MSKNVHCVVKFNNIKGKDNKPVHAYITYAKYLIKWNQIHQYIRVIFGI